MPFKKLLTAMGVGGPTVDTVLTQPHTRPGLTLDGSVELVGGQQPAQVERVVLGLETRVEVESGDHEYATSSVFHRLPLTGAFVLEPGQRHRLPFRFPVPWETPLTHVFGQPLHGMVMGLSTELAIARAVDKGDLDPVAVHPLPAQEVFLQAVASLGFRFVRADVERGTLRGLRQTLPFYQEIEFRPGPAHAGRIGELEVTFVAGPDGIDVVLEADKRGGFLSAGGDRYHHLRLPHHGAETTDWAGVVDGWLRSVTASRW
ncbi:MAG: sporulation protein [Kineosporiaceae bacterium]